MTQVNEIAAKMTLNVSNFTSGLRSAKSELTGVGTQLEKTGKQAENSSGGLSKVQKVLLGFAGIGGAITTVKEGWQLATDALGDFINAANQQQAVSAQQTAVLKSTHGAAGLTADSLDRMAAALQKVTPYSDDAVGAAQNMLLTFTSIGKDVFPQATQAVLDLSTSMKQDTRTSAIQLGKALNDPIKGVTALQRVGIQFDASQKQLIKTYVEHGEKAKAQAIILKELQKEFGGSAVAAGTTFAGKMKILGNQVDLVKKQIGEGLIVVLQSLADKVLPLVSAFAENLPNAVKTAQGIFSTLSNTLHSVIDAFQDAGAKGMILRSALAAIAAIGIAAYIRSLVVQVAAAIPVILTQAGAWWATASAVIAATWPILAIAAAIGIVITLFKHWYDTNEGFRKVIQTLVSGALTLLHNIVVALTPPIQELMKNMGVLWSNIQSIAIPILTTLTSWLGEHVPQAINIIKDVMTALTPVWTAIWNVLTSVLRGAWLIIQGVIQTALAIITGVIKIALNLITGNWSGAWNALKEMASGVFSGITKIVSGALTIIWGFFSNTWGKILGFLGGIFGNILGKIGEFGQSMYKFVRDRQNDIKNDVTSTWNNVLSTVSSFWGRIISTIVSKATALKNAVLAPFIAVRDAIGSIVRGFANNAINMLNNAIHGFQDMANGFGSAINAIASKIGGGNPIPRIYLPMIPRFAKGTSYFGGGLAVVGEEGPELVHLPTGSSVLPAPQTKDMLAGGRVPGFAGGVGDFFSNLTNTITKSIGDAFNWVGKTGEALLKSALGAIGWPGSVAPPASILIGGVKNKLIGAGSTFVQHLLDTFLGGSGAFVGTGGGSGTLAGFPRFNQLAVKDVNSLMDCVPTSLAAGATYLLHRMISPEMLKFAVYGKNYRGGTSPERFASYLARIGVGLSSAFGNQGALINIIRGNLAAGHPVVGAIPSNWNANSGSGTHEVAFAGASGNNITAMNPWRGFFQTASNQWWAPRLRYGHVNPMRKMANGGMLTEPTLGIGLNSGMTTLMGEAGAEAVVPLNGGNSTMVHTTIQIDRKTIADVVGAGIVEQVRRVGGIRR